MHGLVPRVLGLHSAIHLGTSSFSVPVKKWIPPRDSNPHVGVVNATTSHYIRRQLARGAVALYTIK